MKWGLTLTDKDDKKDLLAAGDFRQGEGRLTGEYLAIPALQGGARGTI
jgi:hypothetical protein